MMKKASGVFMVALIVQVVLLVQPGFSFQSTVPAFLWSPSRRHHESSNNRVEQNVLYQTLSPRDLAKSVLRDGGWSRNLCSEQKLEQFLDLAIVVVGTELHSADIIANRHADPALVDLLKVSFTSSNHSMAFPYVAPSRKDSIENSLVSEFKESCRHELGISTGAFLESCSIEDESFQKFSLLHSVNDILISRMQKKPKGKTDLVVFCLGGSRSAKDFDQSFSESKLLSELIASAELSGAKYDVLYVSDPSRSSEYLSHLKLERFLAEGGSGNGSAKSANLTLCDEICQIKSSLLEGLLVGIVLLVILISGLCCMMGIDTPTRFEAPQDS